MRARKHAVVCILTLILFAGVALTAKAQAQSPPVTPPIPIEFVAGSSYLSADLVLTRNLAPGSRFGFFHLNSTVLDYTNEARNDLMMQSLLFFEPVANFRLTGGLFYALRPGFSPTVGVQFVNAGPTWLVLVSPRVTTEEVPSYSLITIVQYRTGLTDRLGLYTSLQALTTFDADRHIRSFQWTRVGLQVGRTQFGLATNLDQFGPDPEVVFSLGLFVRRELF